MPSLKDIRKRISSVKNTQKITRAMKLVAAAKLRREQASRREQVSRRDPQRPDPAWCCAHRQTHRPEHQPPGKFQQG